MNLPPRSIKPLALRNDAAPVQVRARWPEYRPHSTQRIPLGTQVVVTHAHGDGLYGAGEPGVIEAVYGAGPDGDPLVKVAVPDVPNLVVALPYSALAQPASRT